MVWFFGGATRPKNTINHSTLLLNIHCEVFYAISQEVKRMLFNVFVDQRYAVDTVAHTVQVRSNLVDDA